MKVKLFTHTDLDGVGCAIVALHTFKDIDIEYCENGEINDKVREFTGTMQYKKYDKVFITDISVNKDVADLIEYSVTESKEYLNKYQLLDHHATAKWLNEYPWAYVDDMEVSIYPKEEHMKSCGTSMFYTYLWEQNLVNFEPLVRFVEKVRRYDTWEWSTKFNDQHAKQLNDLLYLIGREKFVERFKENAWPEFTDTENLLLEVEAQRIAEYLKKKKEQVFQSSLDQYNVGVVFNEQYHSELGNVLALDNPHYDFIVMIDVGRGTVSYRTIHDHIDVGVIAKRYGGGGHPKAAGSRTNQHTKIYQWKQFVENFQ